MDLYNYNADKRVLTERWQKPGDVTRLKAIQDRGQTTRPTSRFVQDYNMSVSYTHLDVYKRQLERETGSVPEG